MSKRPRNKDIASAINDMMTKGGKVLVPGQEPPKIEAYDLYKLFKHKLNKEAQSAIEGVKVTSTIHERNEEQPDLSGFWRFLEKVGNQAVLHDGDVKKRIYSGYSGGYIRVVDKVMYLGKLATVPKLETAVDRVCNGLNRLAKRGYITGALAPLIGITLARTDKRQKPKVVVASYVAVTSDGEKFVEEKLKGLNFEEGGVPKKV